MYGRMSGPIVLIPLLALFGLQFVHTLDEFEVQVEEHYTVAKRSLDDRESRYRNFRFDIEGREVNLRLKRNIGFKNEFSIYEHADMLTREVEIQREDGEMYHDPDTFAAIRISSGYQRSLHGVFLHEGEPYSIEAAPRRGARDTHKVKKVKVTKTNLHRRSFERDSKEAPSEKENITLIINGETKHPDSEHKTKTTWSYEKSSETSKNKKREVPPVYDVELDIIADCTMWNYFFQNAQSDSNQATMDLANYIAVQVNAADLVYKNIDPAIHGFSVNLFISALHILKSGSNCYWTSSHIRHTGADDTETIVNSDDTLLGLYAWTYPKPSYSVPDHVMLWTRYNLDGPGTGLSAADTSMIGMSWRGGICLPGWDVSIVEDTGYNTWTTVAHELAHNLGSPHDGSMELGTEDCPYYNGNIMAPSNSFTTMCNVQNAFRFSNCSIGWMKFVLDGNYDAYPKVCLTNRVCTDEDADINRDVSQMVGLGFDADEFCVNRFGAGSYHDETNPGARDSMCWQIMCINGTIPSGAPEGADCGGTTDNWCRSGECVSKASNPAPTSGPSSCTPSPIEITASPGCISNPYVRLNLGSSQVGCAEIPLTVPYYCIQMPAIARYCCKDCVEAGIIPDPN